MWSNILLYLSVSLIPVARNAQITIPEWRLEEWLRRHAEVIKDREGALSRDSNILQHYARVCVGLVFNVARQANSNVLDRATM